MENDNKKYIIYYGAFDCQENMDNANVMKIEIYCDLGFIVPYVLLVLGQMIILF